MGHFLNTRIERSNLPVPEGVQLFLKREDEVGFAATGGKLRKLSTLIPHLQAEGCREVAVIGSMHSNNVLTTSQFLLQAGIRPSLFLKEAHFDGPGNAFLTGILVPKSEWHMVPSADWDRVEAIAAEYAAAQPHPTYVLPEGSFCKPALAGAMGLWTEIERQSREMGLGFDHVFIDSGTGLSAAGLILGGEAGPMVHVVQMAMDAEGFEERMGKCKEWAGKQSGLPYRSHIPRNARSFGAVNATVVQDILYFAREHGLLTDPVYSAKLFREALQVIEDESLQGNVLLIHSGGCSTLGGFYDRLVGP